MDELIQVKQLPIIEEQLRTLKDWADGIAAEAQSMVCTDETIQAVKKYRADIRKKLDELETQKKTVKTAVMAPYESFESVYKECISDPFKTADAVLKQKIDDVESEIKRHCEDDLREYFAELCAVHHLDWLTYERSGVKVDMASAKQKTPKKLREQLAVFVGGVSRDMDAIADMDDAEEITTEYKQTLDLARAVSTVLDRHRRIEAEREAAETRKQARIAEVEAVKKVEALAPPTVEPLQVEDKVYKCPFTVYATKAQLKKLKDFLNQEGIRYE